MPESFRTAIRRRFYEATMPALVRKLGRLNELLERLVAAQEQPPAKGTGSERGTDKQ